MKKVFVVILFFCLLVSCVDERAHTVKFLFPSEKAGAVKDSLVRFKELAVEYFKQSEEYYNAHQKIPNLDYRSIGLTAKNEIWFDGTTLGNWNKFEKNKESIFRANTQLNLFNLDKKGFFTLLKFLNDNFIDGITYKYADINIEYSTFGYCNAPFFGSFNEGMDKYIMLKSEFYSLPEEYRNVILTSLLITDNKEDILLLTYKPHVFRYFYTFEENAPEKWKHPTDEIFQK